MKDEQAVLERRRDEPLREQVQRVIDQARATGDRAAAAMQLFAWGLDPDTTWRAVRS